MVLSKQDPVRYVILSFSLSSLFSSFALTSHVSDALVLAGVLSASDQYGLGVLERVRVAVLVDGADPEPVKRW